MSSSTRRGKTSSKRFRAAILASAEAIRCLSVKGSCEDIVRLVSEDWTRSAKLRWWRGKVEKDGSSKKVRGTIGKSSIKVLAAYLSGLLNLVIRVMFILAIILAVLSLMRNPTCPIPV